MEFVIELLLELIFEGSIELSSNRKVPKWIRYPLIVLIVLIFTVLIVGMFIIGIFILDETILCGVFFVGLSIFFLVGSIIKFKKLYLEKK